MANFRFFAYAQRSGGPLAVWASPKRARNSHRCVWTAAISADESLVIATVEDCPYQFSPLFIKFPPCPRTGRKLTHRTAIPNETLTLR